MSFVNLLHASHFNKDSVVKGDNLNLGSNFRFYEGQYDASINANALIVATEWKAFWQPDLKKVLSKMKGNTILMEEIFTMHLYWRMLELNNLELEREKTNLISYKNQFSLYYFF